MVKLKGPGLSGGASGRLADVLTFAKTKNGSYVKRKVIPANPRTGPQMGHRAMVAYLGQFWSTLSQAQKDSWKTRAALTQIGTYHAYMAYNLERWGNYLGPIKQDSTLAAAPPITPLASSMVGGVGHLTYGVYCGYQPTLWGYAVAINLNWGVWPTRDQTIHCFTGITTAFVYVDINNLAPGHYKGRSRPFDNFGNMGNQSGLRNCHVT